MSSRPPNYSSTSSSAPLANHNKPHAPRRTTGGTTRTKILLLGLRRRGGEDVYPAGFVQQSPSEPDFLSRNHDADNQARDRRFNGSSTISTVIPLEIWDCPANTTVESLGVPLSQFSTIIFVIDIRDLYQQPVSKLVEFIVASYQENPEIILEVFVHKAEKLQEDDKIENFRQIHERVSDRLLDMSPEYEQVQLNFHLTSVYDHSLHEAFSRVLHKLIDALPFLEELLNVFCAHTQSPKAFLFDTRSRLYVATDASPVDSATHNLCCDYLQLLNSFGPLYRSITETPARQRYLTGEAAQPIPNTPPPSSTSASPFSPPTPGQSSPSSGLPSPTRPIHQLTTNGSSDSLHQSTPTPPTPTTPRPISNGLTPTPAPTYFPRPNVLNGQHEKPTQPTISPSNSSNSAPTPARTRLAKRSKELFYPSASTTLAAPSATGRGTTTLAYYLVTKNLALLAMIPTPVFEERRGLLEYNVTYFREGVQEICDLEDEARVSDEAKTTTS
ncbi:hypothetical protein D9613_007943 [Agrocybe pediades]|uniref:GTP-binding protein n=1 Tax=Agrocybe pediades TaxID=84607 RepID=A0A8H4QN92_9AGAR|nr:hypothetical protein D9613_007943 [Agrocybe pediades]